MNDGRIRTYGMLPLNKNSSMNKFVARINNVDLSKSLSYGTMMRMRSKLNDHQILVFPRQVLTPSQQLAFTRCFGKLESGIAKRPMSHQVPSYPDLLYLSNEPGSVTDTYGDSWHSDGLAYAKVPHGVTILYCLQCPDGVGITEFANQYAAFENIPVDLRTQLYSLRWCLPPIPFSEVPLGSDLCHPAIRQHQTTGRWFIFCSPSAKRLHRLSPAESAKILKKLYEIQTDQSVVYKHQWSRGDLVVWENSTLLHRRNDVVDFKVQGARIMWRSATQGDFSAIEFKKFCA